MKLATTTAKQEVPEKALQAAIIRRLSMAGFLVVRVNSTAYKTGNRYVRGYSIAGLSVAAGFPDVVAFKGEDTNEAECLLIEVKTAKGELTESQRTFHAFAKVFGVIVHVVRSVEDLEAILRDRAQDAGEKKG